MPLNRVDPKQFEDVEFTLQYFGNTGWDVNEMNHQLIEDQVSINLLRVVATLGKALQARNSKDTSEDDTKSEVDRINKSREEDKKAADNAAKMRNEELEAAQNNPPNNKVVTGGEIQTAESVLTNPANLNPPPLSKGEDDGSSKGNTGKLIDNKEAANSIDI